MSHIPRSSSTSFMTGKKPSRPTLGPRGARQPPLSASHSIKVEKVAPKSVQQIVTPAEITLSFKPVETPVKIDRTIKRSVSFTKNGKEMFLQGPTPSTSESDISSQISPSPSFDFPIKEIYTVEDLLAMKPVSYTTKLSSPGYVMLLHLKSKSSNQNGSDQYPKRKKPAKKQNQSQVQPVLLAHDGDRFISSAASKEVGLYDAKSDQAIRTEAQRILNRLNSRNLDRCIRDIEKLRIKTADLIQLLLDRATMDTEFPERNVQLGNFIMFAIKYSSAHVTLGEDLINAGYEAADKLIGEQQQVPIASFQCLAVWLSTLYKAGMGEERMLYEFFNKVMRNEPKERAIDILRSGLWIAGEKVGPNFEKFFDFLKNHQSQFGYKKFLVDELFALRQSNWKRVTESKMQKSSLKIEFSKKPEQIKEDPHDVDNADIIEGEYQRWLSEEEFEFTKFQPDVVTRLTLRLLPKHFKDGNSFVQYAASILSNSSNDNGRITDIIRDDFNVYSENVRIEENPGMWTIYFMLLAAYFSEQIIKFELIQELILKANETEHPPRLKIVVFRMSEITGVPIDKVIAFKEILGEPTMSDPEFNQGLVALADYTIPQGETELECGMKSMIHGGLVVRDIISAAMQDDVQDQEGMIQEKKELLMRLFELYGRNLISVAKHVIDMYQLPNEKKTHLISFIENDIFEAQ